MKQKKNKNKDTLIHDILEEAESSTNAAPNTHTASMTAARPVVSHAAPDPVPTPAAARPVVSHAAPDPVADIPPAQIPVPTQMGATAQTHAYRVGSGTSSFPAMNGQREPMTRSMPVRHTQTFSASETAHLYADLDGESCSTRSINAAEVRNAASGTGRKKVKKRRKNYAKKHRGMYALIITILILTISIVISAGVIVYGRDVLGINKDTKSKIVNIPEGANTMEIAEILEREGIISHPALFTFLAGRNGKDSYFTAGEHEVRPDMAYETLYEELSNPPMEEGGTVQITFQEGITLQEASEILEETNVCDGKEFLDFFNSVPGFGYTYESYLPNFVNEKFYVMEGYLFPDTYIFYENMDVDLVCQKILSNFNDKISTEYYERMEELDISLDQLITLASIVQSEAGTVEQMSKISSVFWNRLNNSTEFPKLQSDPTSNYVEDVIKPHLSATQAPDSYISYDTYQSNGLPPGAICNPGLDAIRACLYPADTEYYYFYANLNTRETYFSRTLSEHEAIIAKIERNRNENFSILDDADPVQPQEEVVMGYGTSVATQTDFYGNAVTTATETVYNQW